MTCGVSNYYPMNYYHGYNPTSMMRASNTQQPGVFPATMGPSYGVPVVPFGTGQGGTMEESFIENILRYNKGKIGTFYFTYQGNNKWNAMIYKGRVETAGRDHLIISDPSTGKRYLLMMANLDWVEFGEQINYPQTAINPDVQASMTTSE